MKWYKRKIVVYGMIALPLYAIFVICMLTGAITASYCGFAADNNGLLFVGKDSKIDVYDDGEFVKTVYKTSRDYRFTIQDEKLYIATNSVVKVMDLSGNQIGIVDDSSVEEWYRFHKQRNTFVAGDAKYVAIEFFAFYKITKYNNSGENEIVYQSPVWDSVLGLAGPVGFASFMIIFVIWRIKYILTRKEAHNYLKR